MKRTVLVPIEAVEDLDAAIDADESRCRLVSAWQIYRYNDTISSKLRQRLFVRHATNCLPSNTKYDIIRNREKDSVLPMFGHTKEASVLRHWSLFALFGKNTPN